ncbi:MAG: DUF6139 family protein [Methylococcales bacterium]|nr:DUF6139 family protein [Methylococcales bacterium]
MKIDIYRNTKNKKKHLAVPTGKNKPQDAIDFNMEHRNIDSSSYSAEKDIEYQIKKNGYAVFDLETISNSKISP